MAGLTNKLPPPTQSVPSIRGSELFGDLVRSPAALLAGIVACVFILAAGLAPWVAPTDPFDLARLELLDAFSPPAWHDRGRGEYLLGTDNQGRDVLSTILYGSRISLIVGVSAVLLAMVIGLSLGLAAGFFGGWFDATVMRLADVQLSVPAILVALMIDGIGRIFVPAHLHEVGAIYVLILAIGIADWPRFARLVRGATMVERSKEYVEAARVIGVAPTSIMLRHILPNVMGPVLVLATIGLALAITAEATLSFLGVGVPPTSPSLGTLIRVGNDFLFSGEWWISAFPAFALVVLVLAVNMLGDWLRDALNPKLR